MALNIDQSYLGTCLSAACSTLTTVPIDDHISYFAAINIAIAFAILISCTYLRGLKIDKHRLIKLCLCLLCAILITGSGFLIQALLAINFDQVSAYQNPIYHFEFAAHGIVRAILNMFLDGALPGTILTALIITRMGKTPIKAALAGVACLVITDFLLPIESGISCRCQNMPFDAWFPKTISLLCDVFGGLLAGLICRWGFRRINIHISRSAVHNKRGAFISSLLLIGLATSICFTIFYILVLHPVPAMTVLHIDNPKSVHFRYQSPYGDEVISKSDDLEERRKILNQDLPIETQGIHLFAMGGERETALAFKTGASSEKDKLKLFSAHNCEDNHEAFYALRNNKVNPILIPADQQTLRLIGSVEEMDIFHNQDKNKGKGAIYVPYGTYVISQRTRDDPLKRNLMFEGQASFSIEVRGKEAVILKAFPKNLSNLKQKDKTQTMPAIIPATLNVVDVQGREVNYMSSLEQRKQTKCQASEIITSVPLEIKPSAENLRAFFLIEPEHSDEHQKNIFDFDLKDVMLTVPAKSFSLTPREIEAHTDDFMIEGGKGELTIGTTRIQIEEGDKVWFVGDTIDFVENADNSVTVKGSTRFVQLNGVLLNKSYWDSLDQPVKAFYFICLAGAAALLRPKAWKVILEFITR